MSFLTAPQFLLDSVSIERLCMISTAQHVNLAISDLHQIPPASGGNKGEGGTQWCCILLITQTRIISANHLQASLDNWDYSSFSSSSHSSGYGSVNNGGQFQYQTFFNLRNMYWEFSFLSLVMLKFSKAKRYSD